MTEIDLTPITRLEYDIDAILNDHAVAEPITRIELILADIVAGNTTTVVPVTRIETYLAIISGADYPVPEPVTRIETFLAIIAGEDYEEPEAVTRLEGLLAEWVEKGSGIWKTVTGALIHITDALASPMQKCEVTLEPIQAGSGDPSPTNVRPITGWTGCEVTRTGVNVFGGIAMANRIKEVVPSAVIDENAKTITYSASSMSGKIFFTEFKPNKKYTFILSGTGYANMKIGYANAGTLSLGTLNTTKTSNGNTISFLGGEYASGTTILNYEQCGVFEGELTADDFEPYSGTTLSVTFPDTVYGGKYDFVSGVGNPDRDSLVFDGEYGSGKVATDITAGQYGDENYAHFIIYEKNPNAYETNQAILIPKVKCNTFKYQFANNNGTTHWYKSTFINVFIPTSIASTLNEFIAFLANTPMQVVIPLITPTEISLTPQEISTLKGVNNVWSNGDSVEITYKAQSE